ncbi:MAG: hypothetical protein ICV54_28170, partial [Nostoc sp. C3-bin3]|nr:hypothetical protein [Nostoc sp. C3-bin3]
MSKFDERKLGLISQNPEYLRAYKGIRRRCQFQRIFSSFLLSIFFGLQYSVPIFLVVLGSVSSSREQLATFFLAEAEGASGPNKINPNPETTVSQIIYLIGLFTILLGVINTIVRPAESYDTAARYNNKFYQFEQNLLLEFLMKTNTSNKLNGQNEAEDIFSFFIDKNNDLHSLIEEFNEARSLAPRQTHSQA